MTGAARQDGKKRNNIYTNTSQRCTLENDIQRYKDPTISFPKPPSPPLPSPSLILPGSSNPTNLLPSIPPPRSINNNPHQTPRNNPRSRQCDDPPPINPSNHPPINRPPGAGAQSHPNGGAGDALGGADGEGETRGHDDRQGAAELHAEAARGGVQRQSVAQHAHYVVAVGPEAYYYCRAAVDAVEVRRMSVRLFGLEMR